MCVLALPNPNGGVTKLVFLKILKPRATLIFQVKVKLPCMNDDDAGLTVETKLR